MNVNIGKNTLGDSDKMSVNLKEYGRSTHDLSFAWRSTMGVGTLVPCLKVLALPGDEFDINIENKVMTHPTVGPLFGSYKMQIDIFTVPIRLYQAMLHNNANKIGLDMAKVKLPKYQYNKSKIDPLKIGKVGKASILEYLGLRYEQYSEETSEAKKTNAVPLLGYYDICKNYYFNKQEERFYIMGGGENAKSIEVQGNGFSVQYVNQFGQMTSTEGWEVRVIQPKEESFNIKSLEGLLTLETVKGQEFVLKNSDYLGGYTIEQNSDDTNLTTTIKLKGNGNISAWAPNLTIGQYETSNTSGADKYSETYTSNYKIEILDELRENILAAKQTEFNLTTERTGSKEYEFFKALLDYQGTEADKQRPIAAQEMGGLCLKTLNSDIYNNWINTEWIEGENGISAITSIDTSGGSFTIDALNMAEKVYNLLNRIAVSGGSFKDWIETVWTTDYYFRPEVPVYEGGLSSEINFGEVVSNSASNQGDEEQPLGTLAGKGFNSNPKGGNLNIKINEPCYIMGIASITPRVDYSQGQDWDNDLDNMNDLHKPQLDGIGYQDLLTKWMHGGIQGNYSIGKTIAWINYMTNVNKTFGNFAAGEPESYMVLNRIYELTQDKKNLANGTTYINPKDYSYIFATTEPTDMHFWVQIGYGITRRWVGSAKQIPIM